MHISSRVIVGLFVLLAFPVIGQTFTHKNSKIKHNITMLRRYFIYGNLGIFMEVFWTGMQSFIKRGDICLTGTTSVIMFFIYGLVVFMEPLFKQLRGQSAIVRGMTYGILIFAIEFFSGTGLKAVNACPWDYSSAIYNINGLVRLDYYPVWIFVGLVYERIYSFLKYNERRLKNRP